MRLTKLFSILLLAGWLGIGCDRQEAEPALNDTNQTGAANAITAPVDYVGAVGKAAQHSEKVIDTVQVSNAIRQFHAVEDRYPKDLNELVTEGYLVSLPALPAGQRLDYNPTTGQVRIVRQP